MKSTKIAIAAIAFALLSALAHAQPNFSYCAGTGAVNMQAPWYCQYINLQVYNAWSPWVPAAVALLLLSFIISAILISVGIAFRNEKIRAFGLGELYEAGATAIIVALFLYVTASLIGVLPGLFVGNYNPYNTSLTYVYNTIQGAQNLYSNMYNIYMVDSYYASTRFSVDTEAGFAYKALANSFVGLLDDAISLTVLAPIDVLTALLAEALIVLYVEFYLIYFAMIAAIPVFLIPGILFRSFIPTRGLGGMMISIAIGLYVVMPLLFSVAYFYTNVGVLRSISQISSQLTLYGQGRGAQTNAATASSPLSQAISNAKSTLGIFFLSLIFFPALIFGITYAFIITVADFIGGIQSTTKFIGSIL